MVQKRLTLGLTFSDGTTQEASAVFTLPDGTAWPKPAMTVYSDAMTAEDVNVAANTLLAAPVASAVGYQWTNVTFTGSDTPGTSSLIMFPAETGKYVYVYGDFQRPNQQAFYLSWVADDASEIIVLEQDDGRAPAPFSIDVRRAEGINQVVASGAQLSLGTISALNPLPDSNAGIMLETSTGIAKFPAVSNWQDVRFVVRLQGSLGGGANQPREWRVELRRADGTTMLSSQTVVKVAGTDIDRNAVVLESWTNDASDPFTVDGCTIWLVNETDVSMTLTFVEIQVKLVTNQRFELGV